MLCLYINRGNNRKLSTAQNDLNPNKSFYLYISELSVFHGQSITISPYKLIPSQDKADIFQGDLCFVIITTVDIIEAVGNMFKGIAKTSRKTTKMMDINNL